jgi:hypothetical protein
MRWSVILAVAVCVVAESSVTHAYLENAVAVDDAPVTLRWSGMPIRWFATDRDVPGVSATDFQAAAARAFATWDDLPSASIDTEFVGFTAAEPFDDDGLSVLGCQSAPDLTTVLAATGYTIDTVTGALVESDIFFNSAFAWSVSDAGDSGRFDVQSVATHEIGHLLGLGHSALGETELLADGGRHVIASGAVMFPFSLGAGRTDDRVLQPDDVAGISDLYPSAGYRARTGAIRGRVRRDGHGVFGAHVVAFNPETGALIGGFSLTSDGDFEIAGLTPGPHVIRVEPLDDADVESFFDAATVDLDFQVTFYPRLFVVPTGGVGEHIDVTVRPK